MREIPNIPMNLQILRRLMREARQQVSICSPTESNAEFLNHMKSMAKQAQIAVRSGEDAPEVPFWMYIFPGQLFTTVRKVKTRFFRPGTPMERGRKRIDRKPGEIAQVSAVKLNEVRLLWADGDWLEIPWSEVRKGLIYPITWKDLSVLAALEEDEDQDMYDMYGG